MKSFFICFCLERSVNNVFASLYHAPIYFINGLARIIPSKAEAVVRVLTAGIGRADIVSGGLYR